MTGHVISAIIVAVGFALILVIASVKAARKP